MKASELVQAMSEAGAPMEAVLIALKAIEERDEAIEARRANERERKRRQRAKVEDDTGTVTGQSRDTDGTETRSPSLSRPLSPQTPLTPTHTHPDIQPRARKADPFPCPDWCEPAVWADLKRNRKTRKLTNTETAHRQFVAAVEAMADDHWPPGRLIEAIVAKGWGGAHDPRDDRKPGNDNRNAKSTGTAGPAARAIARLSGEFPG